MCLDFPETKVYLDFLMLQRRSVKAVNESYVERLNWCVTMPNNLALELNIFPHGSNTYLKVRAISSRYISRMPL